MYRLFSLLIVLVSFAAPAMATGTEDTIISLEKNALESWEHGDPSAFLNLSAQDVVYFDPFLSQRITGKQALTRYYEQLRGKIRADHYQMVEPRVQILNDAAVLTFNFTSTNSKGPHYWNCTEVYRHDPTGWHIIQTHWSFAKPPHKGNQDVN